ncbi:MAG TPA: hypothetical protein VKY31_15575 [Terriglobia bacterium]|nr:hypothetical protein [Terriglobia bacterium]
MQSTTVEGVGETRCLYVRNHRLNYYISMYAKIAEAHSAEKNSKIEHTRPAYTHAHGVA